MKIFHKIKKSVHTPIQYDLSSYQSLLAQIQEKHRDLSRLGDPVLQERSLNLKKQAQKGTNLNELLPEAYALVYEACIRQLGMRPYEVQMLAAVAMHQRKLVEMQTGEGKTLAAVFPLYLNALSGKGAHLLTFNDYLARRDAHWMGPVYKFLGLSVGYINQDMSAAEWKQAYACDITYATAKTVGFDFLRSGIAYEASEYLLRPFHFVLVDEADAILIDEARLPLVLAGNVFPAEVDFYDIARFVDGLSAESDVDFDHYRTNVFLTESGIKKAEKAFKQADLYAPENQSLHSAINLALHARFLLTKDVDYIVKNQAIKLIDEFTGRIIEDRKWRDGLQTAAEAKEGLKIQSEGAILNAITLQHLLQKYPKLAGMTATAQSSAEEFETFYGLQTVVIPPNRFCRRVDRPDEVFANKKSKEKALIAEIKSVHQRGQPVLIGTLSVKESEELARRLSENDVNCQVLNARNDEKEAAIVAKAGCFGAVTISTNMAGRGTDIVLGGGDPADREKVVQLGGLYVIGTNRHESLRIDRQLRGRAGRQGDIGESRFFISFEDELLVRYKFKEVLPKKYRNLQTDEPIKNKRVAKFIQITQGIIESRFFDMRKALYEFSNFMEKQRLILQQERQLLLNDDKALNAKTNYKGKDRRLLKKLRELTLFLYDKYWGIHLDFLTKTREGIYIVQLGGQNPLREFRRMADEHFQALIVHLDREIDEKAAYLRENPQVDPADLGLQRPNATWTYVVQDNPFGNQLALMLLDNSNIGFTADPISAMFLFFHALWRRKSK